MNRARSTSERFMEPAKTGTTRTEPASKPPSSKPASKDSSGGVAPEEYDRLLGKITEEISDGDVWLTFPEGGRDAVEITSNDMGSVQPGAFLSGNVIDFYIKYLWDGLSCHMHKDHLHFFNSFFFTQLADSGSASTESEQRKSAFEKVQKWTGGVNIFEKSYVFIPVNQSYHWSLIIICHLSSLTGKNDGPPCILHLDSIDGKHGSLESHIRSYIIHAWKERYHDPSVDQLLALSQMKYAEVKVPQQDNHYDCGIYMLHFVELFLVESIGGFGAVPMQGSLFSALWDASEVTSKRRDIRNLILELSLASRRKSRQHQKMISRLLQLMPVSQLSEVFETRSLEHNNGRVQEPQNDVEGGKHSNGGVSESENVRRKPPQQQQQQQVDCEEVEVVKLKEVKRLEVECEDVKILEVEDCDDEDCEEVECEEVVKCESEQPKGGITEVKVRRKRKRNWVWSKDETTVLLECRRIGGRFCRKRKQNVRTDWIAISKEIETKLGTAPSGNQCRLRYAVLLKAYKAAKSYCMSTNLKFAEKLFPGEVKLATHLSEAWYNTIDEICRNAHQQVERFPKRVKFSPTVYAPEKGAGGAHPCTENKCGSQTTEDTMVDSETPESPTRDDDPCSQQRALEYLRAFLRSESQKEPEIR